MPPRAASQTNLPLEPPSDSAGARTGRHWIAALLLAGFAAVFVYVGAGSIARWSATADEPLHLASGYAIWQHGDFRFDATHPPLLRLWNALPLAWGAPRALDLSAVENPAPASGQFHLYRASNDFLFSAGDGDAVLRSARWMTLLLGVALGLLVFCWAREWFGLVPAALAAFLCAIEPNLSAHASLVTTDLGVTCWMLGAVYFLWRCHRAFTAANLAGLCLFAALAIVSKFSAVLLLPILALLLLIGILSGRTTVRHAAITGVLLAGSSYLALWAIYGFRYAPAPGAAPLSLELGAFADSIPASAFRWLDAHRLLPNAYAQGFLNTVATSDALPAFLNGEVSSRGWWYYLPFAFLVKTPPVLLVLSAGGLAAVGWSLIRRRAWGGLFLVIPPAAYLAGAIASGINLGVRHILPVYPFAILLAASFAQFLLAWRPRPGRIALGAVVALGTIQFVRSHPATLTYFNEFAGGPAGGHRYLSDSNLDWGQGLKSLKAWMDREAVPEIALAYAGTVSPAHYGIASIALPGSPAYASLGVPKLPGYVAIADTIQSGTHLGREWRMFYRGFESLTPVATIDQVIRVYRIDRWPAAPLPDREDTPENVSDHSRLAEAYLYYFHWPDLAIPHLRTYIESKPAEVPALAKLALALLQTGEIDAGRGIFRRAQELDPRPGRLGAELALILLRAGLATEALEEAQRAVAIGPEDPLAHDTLGVVLAQQGRLTEALAAHERALELDPASAMIREHVAAVRRLLSAPR